MTTSSTRPTHQPQPTSLRATGSGFARFARATVAASLVICAVLTVTSVLLMPDFSGDQADQLRAIAGAGTTATISAWGFAASQLFLAIGIVGVVHLTRGRVPVLAAIGGALTVLGAFGHAVYGGISITMLSMAQDLDAVDVHAAVLDHGQQGFALPFMAPGLLGTVLGFIILGVAVWRGGFQPRWLGPVMIVWVLVEFLGSSFTDYATYASGALYVVIFAALTLAVLRSSISHWQTASETGMELDG